MRALALLEDVGWLVLIVLMVPLAIVLAGTPVALLVRLILEIGQRW